MTIRRARPFLWALFIAAAVLFFCTKSSPGYPVNDWSDANIYFTIGKGMTQGKVVYRDLYDHKGPLLYALHALCALISFDSFTGVYIMEVLLCAWFLVGAHEVLRLFGVKKAAWTLLPVLAVLVYSSFSFAEGDSAEEMCLPMMMAAIWGVCAYFRGGESEMKRESLIWHGFLTGCVFWVKFTLVGVQAGLLGWVLARHALRREWKAFWRAMGWLVAGFGLSTLPWLIYFGLSGAVGDWLKTYLYDNLFLYSAGESAGAPSRIKAMLSCAWDWAVGNLRYSVLIAAGLVWTCVREKSCRMAVGLAFVLCALLVFMGGKSYAYYGLALAGMTVFGLIPVGRAMEKISFKWLPAVSLAACVAACPFVSHNMTADYGAPFGSAKEDTMQYQIAAHIPKDASLLNYGFMDAGFFTAAGVVPEVKYFHQTNVPLEEMLTEQARYIRQGVCDYVVTRGQTPEGIDQYELIAESESPDFWYEKVYLYRRRDGV